MAETVPLFGGAMSMVLPGRVGTQFHDASRFRQVPDHQEVYLMDDTGASVIVELLAKERSVPDDAAAFWHFTQLAIANEAEAVPVQSDVTEVPMEALELVTPRGVLRAPKRVVFGEQRVCKFNERDRPNGVTVALGVIRLPVPYLTDVLCSVSAPTTIAPGSSEERYVTRPLTPAGVIAMHATIFESLLIHDYALFVEEDEAEAPR